MKKLTLLIFLIISTFIFGACGGDGAADMTIRIGNAPYDYETPPTEITRLIAEELGYAVEVVEGDIGFMFLSLAQDDTDIWPGIWPSIHRTYIDEFEGQIEMGSRIFDNAPTGWAVPKYVEADTIGELVGNEDMVNGQLIGFEPGSGMMLTTEEVVEAHGLDLEIVSGSMASMLAEVDYATRQEEPILFLGWRPHTMFTKYDIKILEDEEGYWGTDSFDWGVNNDFKDKAPEIYNLVNNFEMSIDEVEQYLYANQEEGIDASELAQQWIDDNRADIDAWLEAE